MLNYYCKVIGFFTKPIITKLKTAYFCAIIFKRAVKTMRSQSDLSYYKNKNLEVVVNEIQNSIKLMVKRR